MGAYEEGWLRDKVKDQAAEIERLKLRADTFERQYRQACMDVAFAVNANKQLQAALRRARDQIQDQAAMPTDTTWIDGVLDADGGTTGEAGGPLNSEPGALPDDERQGADSQPMEHDDRSGARKCTD